MPSSRKRISRGRKTSRKRTSRSPSHKIPQFFQPPRLFTLCWKTYVRVPRKGEPGFGQWIIEEKELEQALFELKSRKIPLQRGDLVSFENAPTWGKDRADFKSSRRKNAYYATDALFIFDGQKLIEMGTFPDEWGVYPQEFECFNPKYFFHPNFLYHDLKVHQKIVATKSKDIDMERESFRTEVVWMKPNFFLQQIQQNLTVVKDVWGHDAYFTWFDSMGTRFYLVDDFEEDTPQVNFKSIIQSLKPDTLFWGVYRQAMVGKLNVLQKLESNERAIYLNDYCLRTESSRK